MLVVGTAPAGPDRFVGSLRHGVYAYLQALVSFLADLELVRDQVFDSLEGIGTG